MKDSANAKGWKEVTACRGCKQANQVNDSDVNNSAHAKSHASKKPLLVGYICAWFSEDFQRCCNNKLQ